MLCSHWTRREYHNLLSFSRTGRLTNSRGPEAPFAVNSHSNRALVLIERLVCLNRNLTALVGKQPSQPPASLESAQARDPMWRPQRPQKALPLTAATGFAATATNFGNSPPAASWPAASPASTTPPSVNKTAAFFPGASKHNLFHTPTVWHIKGRLRNVTASTRNEC